MHCSGFQKTNTIWKLYFNNSLIMASARRLLFFVVSILLICSCISEHESQKTNVLFISIDDMNDWGGCMGGRDGVLTPNLDKLAARSTLFYNAHCVAPACCPSRTSVMTGVRPGTSGIYNNQHLWRESPVLANAITIPEFFREQGYAVKGGGKIFHALSWVRTGYGVDQNDPDIWDEYFPSKERSMPESIWPESYIVDSAGTVTWEPVVAAGTENRPACFFDWGPLGSNEEMPDYKVVEWAVEELSKDHDKPLFLAVGIFRPHIPWFVAEEYFKPYPLDELVLPEILENDLDDVSSVTENWVRRSWQEWLLEQGKWEEAVQAYQASMTFSDAMLGRLLRGLEESGQAENTIIVLWSDHGMHIGEKEHWEKFTLWEESTRVPLIIAVPGITPEDGAVCHEAVSLLDVFPTLVELMNSEPWDQLEGISLLPLLKDPDADRLEPAVTTYGENNHAVRTERWRYIHYHNSDEELYDHDTDPDEYYKLSGKEEHRNLMDSLSYWLPKVNVAE